METMTPSREGQQMTEKQIDKAVDLYRAMLRKQARELDASAAQTVLGNPSLAKMQADLFSKCVEAASNVIVRRVKVDRSRTPQQVIDATCCAQHNVNRDVLATMPAGEGEEVDVHFFKPEPWEYTPWNNWGAGSINPEDLERMYDCRGLKPDPYAQAQVHVDDPAFAYDHPNVTQWDVRIGQSSYAEFEARHVTVSRLRPAWGRHWWFAGVRK